MSFISTTAATRLHAAGSADGDVLAWRAMCRGFPDAMALILFEIRAVRYSARVMFTALLLRC